MYMDNEYSIILSGSKLYIYFCSYITVETCITNQAITVPGGELNLPYSIY